MRLIDADKLKELLIEEDGYGYLDIDDINNAPTLEMNALIHGYWDINKCSVCGTVIATDCRMDYLYKEDNKYCYNCGAKMDKEER